VNRPTRATLLSGIILVLSAASANAVPCSSEITRFENLIRYSGNNGPFGPSEAQTVGAQLGHQPTVRSVLRAKRNAQIEFRTNMALAKKFAVQGKNAECLKVLGDAELMFDAR
jgi:hypothetical protein